MAVATPDSPALAAAKFPSRGNAWTMAGMIVLALIAWPAMAQITPGPDAIAGGGGRSASAGGCLVLDGTLGQAVAGSASAGNFAVTSGYWAGHDSSSRDSLFNSGFEGCL